MNQTRAQRIETIVEQFENAPADTYRIVELRASLVRVQQERNRLERDLAAARDALADALQTVAVLQGKLAKAPRYEVAVGQ